ncbi:MAG: hypothetical protein OXE40_10655 [Gammaproteobacteria bacterium]|nr:hypothetical protein [Gammaproteobacteria bacterium]
MGAPDGQSDTGAGGPSAGSGSGVRPDLPASKERAGWRFIAAWIAFAITLILTVWLGVEIVLETKGFG